MNKQQKWNALAGVRFAVKGWAFAPAEWLPRKIERAEEEAKKLPDFLQDAAEEIIAPLREAVS